MLLHVNIWENVIYYILLVEAVILLFKRKDKILTVLLGISELVVLPTYTAVFCI